MNVDIDVAEAEARLEAMLDAAIAGDEVVIARDGRPVVKLMPVGMAARRLGVLAERGWAHDVPIEAFAAEPDDAAASEAPIVRQPR